MSIVDLERSAPQSTSWESLFGAPRQLSGQRLGQTSTWSYLPIGDGNRVEVTRSRLFSAAVVRLERLLAVGAILRSTAEEALRVISVLVQSDSATPQISASSDRGVVVEWLVSRNNLVAQIDEDSTVSIWALDNNDVIQFEYEVPARFFARSADTLVARSYLNKISAGVTNRVAL